MVTRERFQKSKTLCWTCQNAVPVGKYGCSWSRDFEPVEGWKALEPRSRVAGSYRVVECPKYIKEKENDETNGV